MSLSNNSLVTCWKPLQWCTPHQQLHLLNINKNQCVTSNVNERCKSRSSEDSVLKSGRDKFSSVDMGSIKASFFSRLSIEWNYLHQLSEKRYLGSIFQRACCGSISRKLCQCYFFRPHFHILMKAPISFNMDMWVFDPTSFSFQLRKWVLYYSWLAL